MRGASSSTENRALKCPARRSRRTLLDADVVGYSRLMEFDETGILTDENGNALYTFNANAALKSIEFMGKHVGVSTFADRVKIDVRDELIKRLHAGRARVAAGSFETPRKEFGLMPTDSEKGS